MNESLKEISTRNSKRCHKNFTELLSKTQPEFTVPQKAQQTWGSANTPVENTQTDTEI